MYFFKDTNGNWIIGESVDSIVSKVPCELRKSSPTTVAVRTVESRILLLAPIEVTALRKNAAGEFYATFTEFVAAVSDFFDNAPITAEEVDAKIGAEVDILSDRIDTVENIANASTGGSLGSIKPTDAAPTPARNGNYTFSIGGNKPAWLTAEAGITTVKAGDGVAVVYTAQSSYTYTHVDTGSSIEQARSQSTSKVPSSKLVDDELNKKAGLEIITGKNLFNKLEVISGFYIDSTTGMPLAHASSKISGLIEIEPNTVYYLTRSSLLTTREVRFLSSDGTPLKAINPSTNLPFTGYAQSSASLAVKSPANATHFQFTVIFNNTGSIDNVQFEVGSTASTFEEYEANKFLKESEIPIFLKDTYNLTVSHPIVGYYEHDTAILAVPDKYKKKGLIITYQNALKKFVNEQFIGDLNQWEDSSCWNVLIDNNYAAKNYLSGEIELGKNLFDKSKVISGFYIDSNSGLPATHANSKISGLIKIEPNTIYYLTRSSQLLAKDIRFLSSDGSSLKAINPSTNLSFSNYASATASLAVKSPANATHFQFTVIFNNSGSLDNVQFEVGSTASAFEEYIEKTILNQNKLPKSINEKFDKMDQLINKGKMNVKYQLGYIYIACYYDSNKDIVTKIDVSRTGTYFKTGNLNIVETYLSNKIDHTTVLSIVKDSSDDICPTYVNGSYIGGNHGWAQAYVLTKSAHGKTLADVGSIYTDSNNIEFVILRIVDSSKLWIISKNQSTDGFSYVFLAPVGTLSYLSNGSSTTSISSYSLSAVGSIHPVATDSKKTFILDNQEIITDENDYTCDAFEIIESYDIYDLPSVINKLIIDRPVGGYAAEPLFNQIGADKLFNNKIVYRFNSKGSLIVVSNISYFKKVNHSFCGFIQATPLSNGYLYIPKSLPITSGSKTWDFRKKELYVENPQSSINMTSSYWENLISPPDRLINFNSDIVFHMGYIIDRGCGLNRKNNVNRAIYISNSRKLYPMGDSIERTLEVDSFISCAAYRTFKNPNIQPSARTNFDIIDFDNTIYIFLDYHGSIDDSIELPSSYNGKKIEIVEKNNLIIIKSEIVAGDLIVKSNATIDNYGYAVLKLI